MVDQGININNIEDLSIKLENTNRFSFENSKFGFLLQVLKGKQSLSNILISLKETTFIDLALLIIYLIIFFQIACFLYRGVYSIILILKNKKDLHLKEKLEKNVKKS